jgi:ribosomal protein L11 methyltransferase
LRIDAVLTEGQIGVFAALFEEEALSFSCKNEKTHWDILWTWERLPPEEYISASLSDGASEAGLDQSQISLPFIEALEDRDWLAESYRALPPFTVGPFFIYGSHYTGQTPQRQTPLLIEAATAFGSGEHGTTATCIRAIEHVKESGFAPRLILDMGCGSGILAAVAATLWPQTPVHAGDNDPECIRVTNHHLSVNGIENVIAFECDGYADSSPVWAHAPYDFIIANILAGPLITMAEEQARALAHGGYLILSGTLIEQAADVAAAYRPPGLDTVMEFPGGEWMTLLLRKKA